jgi:hypothetical protein
MKKLYIVAMAMVGLWATNASASNPNYKGNFDADLKTKDTLIASFDKEYLAALQRFEKAQSIDLGKRALVLKKDGSAKVAAYKQACKKITSVECAEQLLIIISPAGLSFNIDELKKLK